MSFGLQLDLKLIYSWAFQRINFSLSDYPGFLSLVNPKDPSALNTSSQLIHVATSQLLETGHGTDGLARQLSVSTWNPSSQQAQPEEGMSRAYLPLSWARAWADAPWGQRSFLPQSCASAFPLLKILPSPRCGGCLFSLPYGSLKHLLLREALPDHLAEGDHSVPASVCSASVSLLMFQLHEDRDPICPVHRCVPSSSQGLA